MKAPVKNFKKIPFIFILAVFGSSISFIPANNGPEHSLWEPSLNPVNYYPPAYESLLGLPSAGFDCIDATCSEYSFLGPSTPAEADFNDDESSWVDLSILAPVTPKEAGFEEENESSQVIYKILAPVTPKEAGFE